MCILMEVCHACVFKLFIIKSTNDCDWSHLPTNHALGAWSCSGKKWCTCSKFPITINCICEVSIMMEMELEAVKGYVVGWWVEMRFVWWDATFNFVKTPWFVTLHIDGERERERKFSYIYTSVPLVHPTLELDPYDVCCRFISNDLK